MKPWRPLLPEEKRSEVIQVVQAIGDALGDPEYSRGAERTGSVQSISLASGDAGVAVFLAELHAAGIAGDWKDQAFQRFNRAADLAPDLPMSLGLMKGFAGLAWAGGYVIDRTSSNDDDEFSVSIDQAILTYVKRSPWRGKYDLWSGLVGIGVYALERFPRPPAAAIIEQVIARLNEIAEHGEFGIAWPELASEPGMRRRPTGFYNMGVAHGCPAVIAFLARVWETGLKKKTVESLLAGSVRWLLAHKLSDQSAGCFADTWEPGVERPGSSPRWCYSDAAIAGALLMAARCTGNQDWEQEALAIARQVAVVRKSAKAETDACICHGSAGLVQIFNRLYQQTDDEIFADSARHWTDVCLGQREEALGPIGYRYARPSRGGEPRCEVQPGLIDGAAGTALALLALVTDVEPRWDRLLMISSKPLS